MKISAKFSSHQTSRGVSWQSELTLKVIWVWSSLKISNMCQMGSICSKMRTTTEELWTSSTKSWSLNQTSTLTLRKAPYRSFHPILKTKAYLCQAFWTETRIWIGFSSLTTTSLSCMLWKACSISISSRVTSPQTESKLTTWFRRVWRVDRRCTRWSWWTTRCLY